MKKVIASKFISLEAPIAPILTGALIGVGLKPTTFPASMLEAAAVFNSRLH